MSDCKWFVIFCFAWLLGAGGTPLFAQDLDQLKQKQQQLKEEIAFTRKQVAQMEEKRHLTLNELVTLKKQIQTREAIIANLQAQIRTYENQIAESRAVIQTLKKDIQDLREEYAHLLRQTYINHNSYSHLQFLFNSTSFNEAFQRLRYLKAYTDYRQQQADLIAATLAALEEEVEGIAAKKEEQERLLANARQQQAALAEEKQSLNKKASQFKTKEEQYREKLRKNEAAAAKLKEQIEKMIADAAAKARETNKKAGGGYRLTPEAKALSHSFAANQGQLPWPVERGTIINGFGKKPHPVLEGVYTNNNGIDIATETNATVRAVYSGQVTNSFFHPIFNRGLIISHGEYYTVYLNLKEVYVSEGETVTTKQALGKAFTDKQEGSTQIHLEIWKGTTLLNPAQWLYN